MGDVFVHVVVPVLAALFRGLEVGALRLEVYVT